MSRRDVSTDERSTTHVSFADSSGVFRAIRRCPPRVTHPNFFTKKSKDSAWTSGARPSDARTLTLKECSRVHQNTLFSFKKLKRGHTQTQFPAGGEIPPAPTPLGALTLAPSRLRRSTLAPLFPESYIRQWPTVV